MEKIFDTSGLTAEQKKRIEALEAILADKQNLEKFKAMSTADEVIAFYEEKGFSYGEDEKKKIREVFDELEVKSSAGELSEEELEKIAGGWSWGGFWSGLTSGGVIGALAAGGMAFLCASNPIGWAIGGAVVAGGLFGAGLGLAAD